ncbi:substrate-binding domain-containing protein [Skermanella rosea]|uniref:ABC transporter substrate-binding protein n=1 Tax=Skermanella rosea TaxID=1817965 RepID=UPI0019342977|nr:ABC transporter substrate-binding protein [Skermanella rosea]UEM03076.1 substrate-binding domain-containing protein [Skermanella rosea]
MKAKLLFAALLGAVVALPLSAVPAAAEDKSVLLVLWKGITDSEKAFQAKLAELGIKATYREVNANQDRGTLAAGMQALEADIANKSFDAVYTYGTVATQVATGVIRDRVPVVFDIVFDPVGAKLVKSLNEPGGTVTGVTNGVPIAAQFDAFTKLKPVRTLLVLFNSREPNSNIVENEVRNWAEKHGVNVTSRRVTPGNNSLQEVLAEISSGAVKPDAVFAGADNFLASVAGEIQAAVGGTVPLFGGTQTYVKAGWLAAYTPAVNDMGTSTAELMAKVLKGANPGTLPVVLPTPKFFISKAAAAKHGVTPPADAVLEN